MAAPLSLKKNYRCSPAFQQFYTGGPFAVSADGLFLVCACNDQIKIVNSSDASLITTLEGDTELVTALALSPDDKLLFSASHSRQIRVWDLSTFKCQRSWKAHDGPVMGMACDSSGGLLATAGADRKVLVWDVDGGYCTHYFKGHKGVVTAIIFHPDPNHLFLFSGSDDATVRVWDLVTKKCTAVLEKHFSTVTSLALSENGWTLLSAGRDKVVNLWNLRNYSFMLTVPTYEVLETVCVIRAGTVLAACLGQQLQSSGKKVSTGSPPIYFLTCGERGCVRIWNSESAICLYEQRSSDATILSDKEDLKRGFVSAVILPSDQGLLCVTADQQFLFYCPIQSDDAKFQLDLNKRLVGYNEEVVDLRFLGEEEQFLAVATNLEQVRVYDLASMTCLYVLAGHSDIVLCLDSCISGSGRTFLVTGSKDNSIRLWDAERRCCVGVATGHLGAVGAVAFSKKHRNFFVSGSCDRTLKVWALDGLSDNASEPINLKSKAAVAAHTKDINSLAVSPNDSLVCSGSQDHIACVWTLPELKSVVILRGHKRGIWSVEFSPVDKCVMTASGDKTIKIWSLPDGSCLRTFEGHTSSVLRASFLTRGAQFVSSGADGLLKLWTVKSNECLATFDHHDDKVWALAVGKKTEMLATGGGDAIVNLWYDSTAADKEEALLKDEEVVLKNQEMENALSDADYLKAIQIAFELHRPHKLLDLFSELCRKGQVEDQIETALRALGKEEIRVILEYVREWNTKPKFCHVAHFVLFRVFNIFPPTELIEIKGIGELLEGLIPYSQRHFSRIDRLVRSTLLLDYTLAAMSVINPEAGPLESNNKSLRPSNDELINDPISEENCISVQKQSSVDLSAGKELSKKRRKSSKSGGTVEKKVKKAYAEASAIPLVA